MGVEYSLEYGTDRLEIHVDAISQGQNVLVVDDLLATGGTMEAACRLTAQVGGHVLACLCVVELPDLHGRKRLGGHKVHSLLQFEGD